jgi:hypothetical protein
MPAYRLNASAPQYADLEAPFARVAVLYSGWLGVTIPDRGRTAKQALVEPLGADVIVAGTFLPSEQGSWFNASTGFCAKWKC